eukprot:g18106.t1
MIDPAASAGQCSLLDKRVPIPSPVDILASAAVAHDPEVRSKNVVQHSRRVIKKCRKAEKRYEEQLLQFFKGERDLIDEDLVKKGASQPVRGRKGLPVQLNEQCEHLQKRRKRAAGEKLDLEVVVVDVAKCYKNILVKLLHRPYNRLLAYDPHEEVYKWFESITAIFGSKHSVTGWQRQGKFLRAVLRKKYGLTVEDYVDDFPMFVKRGLGKLVVDAVLELLEELGLPAMDEKVNFGNALEVLGLMFSMENGEPEVYLTEEKKEKIKSTCQVALNSGEFELDELESVVNKQMKCCRNWFEKSTKPAWEMFKMEHIPEAERHAARCVIMLDRSKPRENFAGSGAGGHLHGDFYTAFISAASAKFCQPIPPQSGAVKYGWKESDVDWVCYHPPVRRLTLFLPPATPAPGAGGPSWKSLGVRRISYFHWVGDDQKMLPRVYADQWRASERGGMLNSKALPPGDQGRGLTLFKTIFRKKWNEVNEDGEQ